MAHPQEEDQGVRALPASPDRACAPDGAEPATQSQAKPLVPSAGHTEGPWTYRRVPGDDKSLVYCRIASKGRAVAYAGTYGVSVDGSTSPVRLNEAESEANARLMTAAPDLLSALQSVASQLQMERDQLFSCCTVRGDLLTLDEDAKPDIQRMDDALGKARVAINKALGK